MHREPRSINILLKEAFVATALLSAVVMIISLFSIKFEFVRPIKQELDDFDIYDLFYSGKGDVHNGIRDTNIYIIQAGDTRLQIAQQIAQLQTLQPAVIGIDLSFVEKKEPAAVDSLLTAAITGSNNIVQGFTLLPEDNTGHIVHENFLPKDYLIENGGYINFPHPDSFSIIRSFAPFFENDQSKTAAFATRIAEKYAPAAVERLKERNKKDEVINYHGGIDYYTNYTMDEFEELFTTKQLDGIKGKIVLLGFFTKNDGTPKTMEDLRFTPLNERVSGRSFPDNYGVVIHANILTMLLSNSYIHTEPLWVSYTISFAISFLFIWYVLYLHQKMGHPTHIRLIIVQLPSMILIVYVFLKLFDWFSIKLALTPIFLLFVLSMEMLDLYILSAKFLNKKFNYKTIFAHHK